MSQPAVMDDGPVVPETVTDAPPASPVALRAAPRLWSPSDTVSDPPPALTPKKSRRKTAAVTPPESRDRYSPTIKELPAEERPRERLLAYGAQALTTGELLAILIRTGSGERSAASLGEFLLSYFGSIKGIAVASVEEMAKVKGLGQVKAVQIKAAIEFGNRLALFTDSAKPSIGGPRDVANLLMPDLRHQKKEHLKSLLLDRNTARWSTSLPATPRAAYSGRSAGNG